MVETETETSFLKIELRKKACANDHTLEWTLLIGGAEICTIWRSEDTPVGNVLAMLLFQASVVDK
jgi:hypothetical protein